MSSSSSLILVPMLRPLLFLQKPILQESEEQLTVFPQLVEKLALSCPRCYLIS